MQRVQNSRQDADKLLGFFADCAAKKWPFGQSPSSAVCEKARSAFSRQRSAKKRDAENQNCNNVLFARSDQHVGKNVSLRA